MVVSVVLCSRGGPIGSFRIREWSSCGLASRLIDNVVDCRIDTQKGILVTDRDNRLQVEDGPERLRGYRLYQLHEEPRSTINLGDIVSTPQAGLPRFFSRRGQNRRSTWK